MRIKSLEITDYHPIKHLKLDNLGDTVIIAGANGSGKTRLKQAIVQTLQSNPLIDMTIVSTRKDVEEKYFQGKTLEVKKGTHNQILNDYINSRGYGAGRFVGSLVQIDSQRNIQAIKYHPVSWFASDPDDTDTPMNFYFNAFSNRWDDFMKYIYQKAASRDKKLSDEVKNSPTKSGKEIMLEHPDPFEKYQVIFNELLPGKILQPLDPSQPKEFHFQDTTGSVLPFSSLSSGEQEVIKVLFDVIRKDIRHSVIIVDEPELHLHPTLTFKLIEALKAIGERSNQFIFLTHSADLISTYYSTGDVYFIDSSQTGSNQAHRLSDLKQTHNEVIQLIGQNLGLFAVGKKLIFVEGENSSIDRLAYHLIAQKVIPEAKIIPVGSVSNVITLNIVEEQIRNAVFGIDLYMIRDRDGLDIKQVEKLEKNGRLLCLPRRHIENYFLDAEILFEVAQKLYLQETNSKLTIKYIEDEIKRIATESINFNLLKNTKEYLSLNHFFNIPNVKSVETKSIDEVKNEIITGINASIGNLANNLNEKSIKEWLNAEEAKLKELLETDEWQKEFQGKAIFSKICSDILNQEHLRVRHAYIDIALEKKPEVLDDIVMILESFK